MEGRAMERPAAMDNPDRALIAGFVAAPAGPVPMPTSPLLAALGAELVAWDPSRRELAMDFTPQDLFRQGAGVVQGGALSAMLDFVMGFAGMAALPPERTIATTTLTTAFLAAATGVRYRARGIIGKPGSRVMFATAELECEGRLVATGSSVLLVLEG